MPFIADYAMDNLLTRVREANRLDICSTEPTTYAQATSTYSLGNKTPITVGAQADATPNGRRTTVPAITDGTVTGTGTAGFWSLVDTVNSRLLAAGSLSATQSVTSGNTFTLNSFDIRVADAINA